MLAGKPESRRLTLDQEIIVRSSMPSRTIGCDHREHLGGWAGRTFAMPESKTCQLSGLRSRFHAWATTLRPIYFVIRVSAPRRRFVLR